MVDKRESQWQKRAERFREAYEDAQTEITALTIQRMTWEADGDANAATRRYAANAKARMLAACIERNEYKERLEANRQVVFNILQEIQNCDEPQPIPTCPQCTEGLTPDKFNQGPCWYHRLLKLVEE